MKFSRGIKYILVTIVAIGLLTGMSSMAWAGTPLSDYQAQQQKLKKEMDEQLAAIKEKKAEKTALQSEVAALDTKINRLEKDLESANIQLQVAQKQINEAQSELAAAEKKLAARKDVLASRLRSIYMAGDVSMMDVFFEATSYNDFLVRYDMVQRIMDQDVGILDDVKETRAEIEEHKATLENRAAELETLTESKQASKNELESLQSEKSARVSEAESSIAEAEAYYEEMEAASNTVAAKIRAAQAASASSSSSSGSSKPVVSSGPFTWPIPGYSDVSSPYGNRMHPTLHVYKMHTGVDFPAPRGTTIVAAQAGTVINASYLGGYGNCVIVDHGGGLSSLYAHMSAFSVSNGQSVSAGQKVGEVGSTGNSTGNHLHFEVRVNGDHVSPWGYI